MDMAPSIVIMRSSSATKLEQMTHLQSAMRELACLLCKPRSTDQWGGWAAGRVGRQRQTCQIAKGHQVSPEACGAKTAGVGTGRHPRTLSNASDNCATLGGGWGQRSGAL